MRACRTLLLVALASVGCYSPTIMPGAQQCSVDGKCPDGQTCFPDGRCYLTGAMPDCYGGCSGATPVCDKTALKCVQCLADGDCGAGQLCHAQLCVQGCSATHPTCAADAGLCDVDGGICRGCNSDTECASTSNPRCDLTTGHCVKCLLPVKADQSDDNCAPNTYCAKDTNGYTCVAGCKVKRDCQPVVPPDLGSPPDLLPPPDLSVVAGDAGASDGGAPPDLATTADLASPDLANSADLGGQDGGVVVKKAMDCCNHACVDTLAAIDNCGVCGVACAGAANTCCTGSCKDVLSDVQNCGGCGVACHLQNVLDPTCIRGVCTFTACQSGWADCDGNKFNGCETNIAGDVNNCGVCGTQCGGFPNAVGECKNAKCVVSMCNPGYRDCNGVVKDGCEVNTGGDPQNCGSCGAICPSIVNGVTGCNNGKCAVDHCDVGFRNCSGVFADGCNINIFTNNQNCGGCGVVVDVLSDRQNCGGCNNQCGMGQNCRNGTCVGTLACVAPRANCDGNAAHGCNVDTSVDPNNCGKCGLICAPGQGCVKSQCIPKVLLVSSSPYTSDVQSKIASTGAFAGVDVFDATGATPTPTQLANYDVLLVFSDNGFADPNALGDVLAKYYDAGGHVVLATFANCSGLALGGAFGDPTRGYVLLSADVEAAPSDAIGAIAEPGSPLLVGVNAFSAQSAFQCQSKPINGATVVASWKGGGPLVVRGSAGGRNRVDLNFYPASASMVTGRADFWTGDGANLLRNALLYR